MAIGVGARDQVALGIISEVGHVARWIGDRRDSVEHGIVRELGCVSCRIGARQNISVVVVREGYRRGAFYERKQQVGSLRTINMPGLPLRGRDIRYETIWIESVDGLNALRICYLGLEDRAFGGQRIEQEIREVQNSTVRPDLLDDASAGVQSVLHLH